MQEPKKPDETGKRRPPPPPPNRPPARAPGGMTPPPRPGGPRPPTGAPGPARPRPDDGLDAAPPRPSESSEEELVFMTHAPGATVAPRPMLEVDKEVKAFEERIKAKDAEKAEKEKADGDKEERRKGTTGPRPRPGKGDPVGGPGTAEPPTRPFPPREGGGAAGGGALPPPPRPKRSEAITRRLVEGAGRVSEAAGAGALQRALQAGRTVQPAGPAVQGPSFWSLLPAALVTPLRGGSIGAAAGATLLLALALLVVEVSPPVGLIACAVVAVELVAVMVKHVRECGGGRDDVTWPTFTEAAGGFVTWAAAGLLVVPALALAAWSYGPTAWSMANPASLPARAGRVWSPPAEVRAAPVDEDLPGGDLRVPDALGRHALAMIDAAIGPALPASDPDPRTARELALDVSGAAQRRARALAPPPGATPLQLGWRGLLVVGLLLYPIAMIACARLKSAYAALLLPMLLRAVLRAPIAYAVILVAWAAHLAALLAALTLLPAALHTRLDPTAAHAAWIGAVALVGGPGVLVLASILGRFYRSQSHALAWE